jgi:hypothetical protein
MAIENIPAHSTGWFGHTCQNCHYTLNWVKGSWVDSTDGDCCHETNDVHVPVADTLMWVNAYSIVQCYGGPEEGGWWFDAGECLASIPCTSDEQVNEAIDRLSGMYQAEYSAYHKRSTSTGDGIDLAICVEDSKGSAYPEQRPHYE